MSTKKKSVKQPGKSASPPKVKLAAPPIRYPEHKGTPLRPGQFPTSEQLSLVAASLARSLPDWDKKTDTLVQSALSLWLAARDCINEHKQRSDNYWEKMDKSQQGIERGYAQVKLRLEKMGASVLADQLLREENGFKGLSWEETEKLVFPHSTPKIRRGQLDALVSDALLGTEGWWRLWTLDHFKDLGFNYMALVTLIQHFDYKEIEREKDEISNRMKEVRAQRPKKSKWGILSASTSRKKNS